MPIPPDSLQPGAPPDDAVEVQRSAEAPATYEPSPRDLKLVSEVERKFTDWRQERQNYEPQWYINAAMFRGNQDVTWNPVDNRLNSVPIINPNRSRRKINRLFAKVRARRAKFLRNRPTWVIVPATSEIKDKLDARATGKVLDYIWRKLRMEAKYGEAVRWADTCGRGYWWFGWDPSSVGRIQTTDEAGKKAVQEGVVGEVTVEVGSPFELLVGDPGASSLAEQAEIIRAKERPLSYLRAHYPDRAHLVSPEAGGDTFQYENQIANLNSTSSLFGTGGLASQDRRRDLEGNPETVIVKEYFRRPSADLPKGKYCVVANGVLLREQDELPHGFWDYENPFPCVEFIDVAVPGQYWSPTVLEQLIELQREYNGIRSMISTNIRLMGHPKVFVAKQHQIPDGAWSPDAGEIIEYTARPGIKEPFPWVPPNIIGDAWRMVELLRQEFDDVSQIYPEAEGRRGGSESGFQTNLLQEASDSVHAPDVRGLELAIEEAAFKIRRIIKRGYDVPRLVTVTSTSYQPEVFEFSSDEVDEYADIVVQSGSALPMLKGARIQAALDLYAKGVFGDPADPQVRRRVLNVLDMGGIEDIYEYNRIDEEMINIENSSAEDGLPLAAPRFFENHQEHWVGHINKLKSPAVMHWPQQARMNLLAHAILHASYINQAAAYQMSIEAGLEGLVPPPMQVGLPGMAPAGGPPAGAPPGAGGNPPSPGHTFQEAAPPQGGPPPPLAAGGNPNSNH